MNRDEIRALIAEVLNTTLINPEGGPETAADRHTRHDAHKFYYRCAVCQGDVPLLADAIAAKICLTAESPPSPGAPESSSPEREVPAPAPSVADRSERTTGRPAARVGGRVWRIEFPPAQDLLNANQRRHWANKAAAVRQLRSDAFYLTKHHKVPHLERAHIEAVYEPPDKRRRDPSNWQDAVKACVDGVVDAGVLDDDDSTHLIGPDMRLGDPHTGGRLVLIITELDPATKEPA
jgi:hypothetical protein